MKGFWRKPYTSKPNPEPTFLNFKPMKLTAGSSPFGEKTSKREALESIKQTMKEIAEICNVSSEEFEETWAEILSEIKD